MKAMILAAGYGKRLRPLTETIPKPLLKVGDKPLIQYHIENLAAAGVRELVINTAWLGDQIEAFLGNGAGFGVDIVWSREHEPLETGGGITRALPFLGNEPFLLINGDVWTDYPLAHLVKKLGSLQKSSLQLGSTTNDLAHLVLVPNPVHNTDGDYCLIDDLCLANDLDGEPKPDSKKQNIGYPKQGEQAYTFSGISVMTPQLFSEYSPSSDNFPLRDVLTQPINQGRISGELFQGAWWDIGTLERLQALDALISKHRETS